MNDSVTIELPLPHPKLNPNRSRGLHWAAKSKLARSYRDACGLLALEAQRGSKRRWTRATISVAAYYETPRRRDADNLIASLKPAFDGLVDAGLLADDSGVTIGAVTMAVDPDMACVLLHVTPIMESAQCES